MSLHSLFLFVSSLFVLFFNLFTYLKNTKSKVNLFFAIFGVSIFIWLFSFGIAYNLLSLSIKLTWFKIGYVGIIFIPINFYIFIRYLLGKRQRKSIIIANYIIGVCFAILNFSPFSLIAGLHKYPWGHYPIASLPFHPLFLLFFNSLFTYSTICLIFVFVNKEHKFSAIQRIRIKYILAGTIFGIMGIVDYIPNYGINIFPFGFIFMLIYPMILTYAIIRYRLMDISLAITRTGIFITVYSLVLGLPFVVAFGLRSYFEALFGLNWWMAPLVLSTILATAGPFIYLYIQHKAEDRLLREQRRYQQTLRQASVGMTRVKDLQKLLNLIVHIVTRTVRLKHGSIYLLDDRTNQYELRAIRDKGRLNERFRPPSADFAQVGTPYGLNFDSKSALIWNLILEKEPLVYEEVKQKMQDYKDEKLAKLEQEMRLIDAAVVAPSFVKEKLLGFIVLGEKLSGKIYSQDDLSVFSVLANQAGLAIENAEFYEDIKETQTQLFHAEKMATIGTMADGLSHQINNRFHALGMISADALDALKSINENSSPQELKAVFSQLNHALERVKENVKQGGEVVHSLLKYSRAGEVGFEPVDLDTLINSSLEMAQYKVKLSQIDFFRDYTKDIPKIKGNFTQLQEVFFNLIDNAYDAVVQRRAELQEPDYRGNVTIQAVSKDSHIEIRFIDNGMGVKNSEKERLFTPFFTSKTSSKKGTGLGLYVIQKIIVDNHKGKIFCESEYKTGTMFVIELPTANV